MNGRACENKLNFIWQSDSWSLVPQIISLVLFDIFNQQYKIIIT